MKKIMSILLIMMLMIIGVQAIASERPDSSFIIAECMDSPYGTHSWNNFDEYVKYVERGCNIHDCIGYCVESFDQYSEGERCKYCRSTRNVTYYSKNVNHSDPETHNYVSSAELIIDDKCSYCDAWLEFHDIFYCTKCYDEKPATYYHHDHYDWCIYK